MIYTSYKISSLYHFDSIPAESKVPVTLVLEENQLVNAIAFLVIYIERALPSVALWGEECLVMKVEKAT